MRTAAKTAISIAVIFLAGCVLRIWEGARPAFTVTSLTPARDSLTACINIRSGMYTSRGFMTGFQYTMLTGMADTLGLDIGFSGVYDRKDCWQMLSDSLVDIVAVNVSDTVPDRYADEVVTTMPFMDYAWAVRKSDHSLLWNLNLWLGTVTGMPEYGLMVSRFFRSYSLRPYLEAGTMTDRISPYDEIVKANSILLGWDWRLLSAVIFKESRFSVGARSRRGAVGLMQVMRSTAAVYGITDLFNPENNIKAGTMHLRQIERRYQKMGFDSVNVVKFTLAAYNAGESRIEDCINFTLDQGRDFTDWETVAATIPMMAEHEYVEDADFLRHGRFRGRETVQYVRDVLSKYEEYLTVVATSPPWEWVR